MHHWREQHGVERSRAEQAGVLALRVEQVHSGIGNDPLTGHETTEHQEPGKAAATSNEVVDALGDAQVDEQGFDGGEGSDRPEQVLVDADDEVASGCLVELDGRSKIDLAVRHERSLSCCDPTPGLKPHSTERSPTSSLAGSWEVQSTQGPGKSPNPHEWSDHGLA